MSRRPPTAGAYITVYLVGPLLSHVEEQSQMEGVTAPSWIKDRLMDAAPPAVREQALLIASPRPSRAKSTVSKPEPAPPPPPKPDFDTMVEQNRQRVLDLYAKGYSANSISAVLKVPYRVVDECIYTYTKAKPKKGEPK